MYFIFIMQSYMFDCHYCMSLLSLATYPQMDTDGKWISIQPKPCPDSFPPSHRHHHGILGVNYRPLVPYNPYRLGVPGQTPKCHFVQLWGFHSHR